ncbi:MAG: zf-HC2 domain-containing protein [Candidatus Melainabacteria bacterium]|nr:zf-HC2 domain-containing protein [Candidatus Melainabacteria bacterium]
MNDFRGGNCKNVRELLSSYRDAELDSNERPMVEAHLEGCADCREELAAVEAVVQSLKRLPAATLSKDFSLDIESLIKKSEAQKASENQTTEEKVIPLKRKKPVMWLAAAAAALVLMVGAYVSTTGGGVPIVATGGGTVPQDVVATNNSAVEKVAVSEDRPLVADASTAPTPLRITSVAGTDSSTSSDNSSNTTASASTTTTAVQPASTGESTSSTTIAAKPDRTSTKKIDQISAPVVASAVKKPRSIEVEMHLDDLSNNQALVAFTDLSDDGDSFDNLGISTDEDGLYAIKM